MSFIFKRFNEAVLVDWPGAVGVKLKIRPLTRKILLRIHESCKKGKVAVELPELDPKTGKPTIEIVDNFDEGESNFKIFEYVLQNNEDWSCFFPDGSDKPKREEIIDALFEHAPLRIFAVNKALELGDLEELKVDRELKNSEGSQNG
jgi:hypothetical protein